MFVGLFVGYFFPFSLCAVVHLSNYEIRLFQALTSRNSASIHVLKCILAAEDDEEGRKAFLGWNSLPSLTLPHSDVQGSGNILVKPQQEKGKALLP